MGRHAGVLVRLKEQRYNPVINTGVKLAPIIRVHGTFTHDTPPCYDVAAQERDMYSTIASAPPYYTQVYLRSGL